MAIKDVKLLDLYGNSIISGVTHKPYNLKVAAARITHIADARLDKKVDLEEALTLAYLQGQFDSAMVKEENKMRKEMDEGSDDIIFKT